MSSTYSLYSGDSKTLSIPLTLDGSAFNPAGFLLIFTAKKAVTDDDAKAVIQKVTGTGLTVSGTTATIALVPQDTASLARENLFCDIQAQHLTTGAVATVAFFRLRIDRDVTRSTTTSIPVVTAAPGVPIGPTGATGPMGPSATVSVGTVTTGASGTSAAITNSGNSSAAIFNFTLPRGTTGATGATGSAGPSSNLSIASVATGAAGSAATVSVGGTAPSQTLAFSIPRGDQGVKGDTGATGSAATLSVGTVSTGAAGSSASVTNNGNISAATLNFTIPRGDKGDIGNTGPANTLSVAGVTTGAAGSAASVTIGGTSPAQTLTFEIPKGDKGDAATVTVGTVSTGAVGSGATVSNTGTSAAAVLAFSIPRGDTGATGATGAAATIALGNVTTGEVGSSATATNSGNSSAAVFDFTIPRGDIGVTGATGTAATISLGAVATGAAGSSAAITNSGNSSAATFDFSIPRGDTGPTGPAGATTIPATTAKTTPIDTDAVVILDSAASNGVKNVLFSNLWAWIKAKIDTNLTIAGAKSCSGQVELTGQSAASASSAMTRGLIESDVTRMRDSIVLSDQFITGGTASGTIGSCGWAVTGTGASYASSGNFGQLVPAAPLTSALNGASLGLRNGAYTGNNGMFARTTTATFSMAARINQSYAYSGTLRSAWSFCFAASVGDAAPTRVIPPNSVGIASIPPTSTTWAITTARVVGDTVNPTTLNGYKYICTTAGTSGVVEPTWPTTYVGTVADGTAVWTNAGRAGQSTFLFFVAGADPLVNVTYASSTVNIPTTGTGATYYDLSIVGTATGYSFSVNNETPVAIANTTYLAGSPVFCVRNDASQSAASAYLRLRNFGFYSATRP